MKFQIYFTKTKYVCHPGVYHSYFTEGLGEGKYSTEAERNAAMNAINKAAGEEIAFAAETYEGVPA